MKLFYIAAVAVLASMAAFTATAQTAPAQTQISPVKLAVIDTEAFNDSKTGIKRLIDVYNRLDIEFKPKRDEITTLQARYTQLVKEVQAGGPDQKILADKADQARTLESDIKRKQEDGQKALERRLKELTDPINADLANAVQTFAKQRGIDILLDGSKFAGGMMIINQAVDVTGAFIAEYNSRAAGAPVKP